MGQAEGGRYLGLDVLAQPHDADQHHRAERGGHHQRHAGAIGA
jgi:hypothetical protein